MNISATSYPGYTFDRWDGNGIEQPTESITSIILSDNSRAQAIFSPVMYQLDVNHTDGGLTLGAGSYPYGTSVNLTALALDGYSFLRWEGVEIDKQFSPEISIPILGPTSVKAIFEPIQYKLEIESTNGGVAYGQGLYDQGTLVHIRAVPSTGYQFSGWVGNGIDNRDLTESTISLNQDTSITANFVLMDNFFTPRAGNFSLWVDRKDYQSNDLFYRVIGQDGDGDAISYQLIYGNEDQDEDGVSLFNFQENGDLRISDPDEISIMSGSSINLIISLQDTGGKSSQIEGSVIFAPEFVLNSEFLGNGWYDSPWLGTFLQMENYWLYHRRLGWLFVHSLNGGDYWFWDAVSEDWLWTNETFFPWVFSNSNSGWIYFNLNSEKVRFFNHNLQEWNLRP